MYITKIRIIENSKNKNNQIIILKLKLEKNSNLKGTLLRRVFLRQRRDKIKI